MDGPVAVAAVNGNGLQEPIPINIDPQPLVNYLSSVLQALLGATEQDLTASESLLHPTKQSETLQRCSRFAQEPQAAALYISKARIPARDSIDVGKEDGINGTSRMLPYNRL
jgi:dynein heavy chain 1